MIWKGTPLGFERDGKAIDYTPATMRGNAPCLVQGPPGSFKSVGLVMYQLLDDDSGKRSFVIFGDGKAGGYCGHQQISPHGVDSEVANYASCLSPSAPT